MKKNYIFFQWCIHENSRLYLLELTCSLSAYFKTLEEVYAEWRRMQNRYLSTFVVSCPQPGRCCKLGALRPIFWNINIFTITWNFFITPKWDDLKGICFVTKTVETGHSITVYNYNAQKFWWGGQKQNWYYPFAFFLHCMKVFDTLFPLIILSGESRDDENSKSHNSWTITQRLKLKYKLKVFMAPGTQ